MIKHEQQGVEYNDIMHGDRQVTLHISVPTNDFKEILAEYIAGEHSMFNTKDDSTHEVDLLTLIAYQIEEAAEEGEDTLFVAYEDESDAFADIRTIQMTYEVAQVDKYNVHVIVTNNAK